MSKNIQDKLERHSERVTTDSHGIYFDNDLLDGVLAEFALKLLHEEEAASQANVTWGSFVQFLEKLFQNPDPQGREAILTFINSWGLTIRPDGDFIAYKGVNSELGSVHRGPGVVNGVRLNGSLPNLPGSVLEYARSGVDANKGVACAAGLHAGTISYASGWGPRVVAVAINPRDVVTVPSDSAVQKIRVSRYEVLLEVEPKKEQRATVSRRDSQPFWNAPAVAKPASDEAKALKAGDEVVITYNKPSSGPKDYTVTVVSVSAEHAQVKSGEQPYTFKLNRITAVKPVVKKGETAKLSKNDRRKLREAIKDDKRVTIVYDREGIDVTYVLEPLQIADGLLEGHDLKQDNRYKTFTLTKIKSVRKGDKSGS